jgi:hypothetical protein
VKHVLLCARKVLKTNAKEAIGTTITAAVIDAKHALEEVVQEMAKVEANLGKWHPTQALLKVNKSGVNN